MLAQVHPTTYEQTFMDDFQAASLACLPHHTPQALTNTAWALSVLGIQPSPPWLTAFWQVMLCSCVVQQDKQPPRAVACHSCDVLRHTHACAHPCAALPLGLQTSATHVLDYQPQDLSMLFTAVARLQLTPVEAWVRSMAEASLPLLPRFPAQVSAPHTKRGCWCTVTLHHIRPAAWGHIGAGQHAVGARNSGSPA